MTCPVKAPPVKIGAVRGAAQFQVRAGPLKRFDNCVLDQPNAPVSEIEGKYCALATPIRALAPMSSCSARRMSGRLSRRSDGNPAGTAGFLVYRLSFLAVWALDCGPKARSRAFSCSVMDFSINGIVTSASSYCDFTWLSSRSETYPALKRSVKIL